MLTKRWIAIFLCLLLVFSLAACRTQTPATDPSTSTSDSSTGDTQDPGDNSTGDTQDPGNNSTGDTGDPQGPDDPVDPDDPAPAQPRPLTQDELSAIEEYLNDVENNGFIGNNHYTSPSEIDLHWVFYDGAGIKLELDQWAEGEAEAVLTAAEWQKFHFPPTKIPCEAASALLLEECGLTLADFPEGFPRTHVYVKAYDAIYFMHDISNLFRVAVESGQIDENGQHIIRYTIVDGTVHILEGDKYTVTLLKTDNGYRFVSNIREKTACDSRDVHEIGADKITINDSKKTYKGQTITLSVPVDWSALEQHGEDGTIYYFEEPTLDRCRLSFTITGSQYARERTEAEYLELFSHWEVEDLNILSYTKESLSGWACTKVVYSYTYEGVEYIAIDYDNVITGFRLYNFSIIYPAAESERFAPIFEAMMDSMVLQPA